METNYDAFLNSSVLEMKKAVIYYNDILNSERLENFFIFAQIALNRFLLYYCLKHQLIEPNNKNQSFIELIEQLKTQKFLSINQEKILITLNKIYEHIALNLNSTITLIHQNLVNEIFTIYKEFLESSENENLLDEHLFLLNNEYNVNPLISTSYAYDPIAELLQDHAFNYLTESKLQKEIEKETIIVEKPIEPTFKDFDQTWKKSGDMVKIIQNYDKNFNTVDFTNFWKYFNLVHLKGNDDNWTGLNINKNYLNAVIDKNFQDAITISTTHHVVNYHHSKFPELIINFINQIGKNDYKEFLKEKNRNHEKGDLKTFFEENQEKKAP